VTPIAAAGGDAQLLAAWRRGAFAGEVHSVFERVVNLADAGGNLVSLASRSLDDAPGTLRVDAARLDGYGLRTGMRAHTRGATLHVDEARFAVRFGGAPPWHARLPAYPGDDTRLRANLAAVRSRVGEEPPLLATRSQALGDALRRADIDLVCTHGRALLGLGPGLTPSGDDLLVGVFAVLNLAGSPCAGSRRACDEIVAHAKARTNAISTAALREAARGRVRDSVQALVREVVAGGPPRLPEALARVLAIGSTSGRDMVCGIVCGLTASLQARAVCAT
jgi:hypothetical protein